MVDGEAAGSLLDVDIDALARAEVVVGIADLVDGLDDAGIDAFGGASGEVALGDGEGFDAQEGEGERAGGVAAGEGEGGGVGVEPWGVFLVDVNADVERRGRAEDDQGVIDGGGDCGGGVLAGACGDLVDDGVEGCAGGQDVAIGAGTIGGGLGAHEVGVGDREVGDPGAGAEEVELGLALGEASAGGVGDAGAAAAFFVADGAGIGEGLDELEVALGVFEEGLGLGDGGLGDGDVLGPREGAEALDAGLRGGDDGVARGDLSVGRGRVEVEEGVARADVVAGLDVDARDPPPPPPAPAARLAMGTSSDEGSTMPDAARAAA